MSCDYVNAIQQQNYYYVFTFVFYKQVVQIFIRHVIKVFNEKKKRRERAKININFNIK